MQRPAASSLGTWLKTEVVDEWGDVVHVVRAASPVESPEQDNDYYNRLVRVSSVEQMEDAEMALELMKFQEDCRQQTQWESERLLRDG